MKKLISTILVLAFVLAALSAIVPSVSAKSATISERDAKELVVKAGQLFRARVSGYNNKYFDTNSDERKTVHFPEYNIDVTYRPVLEAKLPGGSYAAMCALANEVYTEDIASSSYNIGEYGVNDGTNRYVVTIPNFYVDENGKVFAYGFLEYGYISVRENTVNLVSNIRGDMSEASAIIAIHAYWADAPRPYYYFPIECKFVNTADGWRIAESEFSILFANDKSYLDDYRKANPDKVSADVGKLLDAEAKYVVDEAVMDYLIEMYCGYYERYLDYVKREHKEVKEIAKEITDPDGSKRTVNYVENIGIDEYAAIYFTDDVAESFMTKAYHNNDLDMFITEGDTKYLAYIDGADDLSFVYDPEDVVVELVESTEKDATARVYCGLKKDGKIIPIYVECKFEKNYQRWYIAESDFVDMLNSADRFEYTVGEAPSTGDNAFDAIAICLGGMALVMSVIALIPRKKRETL